MKTIKRAEVSHPFTLPNGVLLRVDAHARPIKNSDRINAKVIGIDWETITTTLHLNAPGQFHHLLSACLDDEDASHRLDEDALLVAHALGSTEYAEPIKNAVFHARAKVLALRGETTA